ncbi:MAG: energy transducer TonB, partial [Bryobacteraceae bacterium]
SRLVRISLDGPLAETRLPAFGRQLMDRAVELEPTSPQWKETIAAAMPREKMLAAEAGAVMIGPVVMESSLLTKVDPVYPPLALRARIQGTVGFNILIDKDGSIKKAEPTSGHPLLVDAAREALMKYRFIPTLLNGKPVPVVTQAHIRFSLPHDSN